MKYIMALLLTFLMTALLTPYVIKAGYKFDFLDRPTERKNHKNPVPLVGGISIFLCFFLGYIVFIRPLNSDFVIIFLASLLVFFVGLIDDYFKTRKIEFAVWPRLLVQIFACILIFCSGIVFTGFTNPFTGGYILLPIPVQFILTITWILGVTTVINWSDGLDGLSGSLSLIGASTLFVVAMAKNQTYSAMMCIILMGALMGFLKYNRFPAKVFIGDSGANFAGFILAIIALDGAFKQATMISLFIPILALGVPIFDNLYVIFKRFLRGVPIYKADASQIHHRLLSTGLNQVQTLVFIVLISLLLSITSIILFFIVS